MKEKETEDGLQLIITEPKEEQELNEAIDLSLAILPLEVTENKIMQQIIEAPTKEELQTQLELFNINQSKKNAMRIVKLSNLLNKVEDQAIERFERRPDQVSNKELLEYMNVVSNQIDRAQKSIDAVKDAPAITLNNQKNELNINVGPQLDRDSKERVMDVISLLLKQVQKTPTATNIDAVVDNSEDNIIDLSEETDEDIE